MERAISSTLRTCMRHGKGGALRCRSATASKDGLSIGGKKCIATNICPARKNGGVAMSSSATSMSRGGMGKKNGLRMEKNTAGFESRGVGHSGRRILRGYSTENTHSSIEGTIGEGEAGIESESARQLDALIAPEHLNEKEAEIFELLKRELEPSKLEVQDISGGCGSMYGIEVVSERFRGLGVLKQQRLVNGVLGERIKEWHGVQLKTRAP